MQSVLRFLGFFCKFLPIFLSSQDFLYERKQKRERKRNERAQERKQKSARKEAACRVHNADKGKIGRGEDKIPHRVHHRKQTNQDRQSGKGIFYIRAA